MHGVEYGDCLFVPRAGKQHAVVEASVPTGEFGAVLTLGLLVPECNVLG